MPDTPLYNALVSHARKGRASFHTPGHKSADVFPKDFYKLDFTELPDTDSLFEAEGAILQAEQEAARLFNVKQTVFSAGGCTMCIQAMLRMCAPNGGTIISGRTIHRSAVNTMALLGITPVWVMPRPDAGDGLPGRIQAQDVARALRLHPDAKAVYLTSPDYYGVIADVKAIAQVCAPYGVPILVDNAHGAHLKYVGGGLHPIDAGAAMTACSAHKTLPVLTGGAWLNCADDRYADRTALKEAMALFGSTSPSYPVMASLDLCRAWLAEQGSTAFSRLEERVARVKRLAAEQGIAQPLGVCDPVRISLYTAGVGMTGTAAAEYFRQRGIEPEYADGGYVVLIATPMNGEPDFVRLEQAICAMPKQKPLPRQAAVIPLPVLSVPPREAVLSPSETVELAKSVGRIAAQAACPCPPGVPVVMPGEVITQNAAEFLTGYGILAIKVLK